MAHILDNTPGRATTINGEEYLFFSGYNYLGINSDPEFLELLQQGLSRYGWIFPSSRISNTQLALYRDCEALLANLTGTEDALLLPSGFTAGRIATGNRPILNAPGSHPAIFRDGAKQRTFAEWSDCLVSELNNGQSPEHGVASDSLSTLSATIYDFQFLDNISRRLTVVLDDSHGIGLTGVSGKGVSSMVPQKSNLDYLYSFSLSKAFGVAGGAICCSKEAAATFRSLPEYTAVTPPSPAQLFAFLHGKDIYEKNRIKLFNNIKFLAEMLHDLAGIHFDPRFPVFILNEIYAERLFFEERILISSFAYPDPKGKKLNRIVVNALHTREDLERLSECLHRIYSSSQKNPCPITTNS